MLGFVSISELCRSQLITFDARGISSHPNHIAVHAGVCNVLRAQQLQQQQQPKQRARHAGTGLVAAHELVTVPLLRKYLSVFDLPLLLASFWWHRVRSLQRATPSYSQTAASNSEKASSVSPPPVSASALLCFNDSPRLSYRAMQAHASQFVWYRRLFVVFSNYTFFNLLLPISVG